jgi:hypothetical protein
MQLCTAIQASTVNDKWQNSTVGQSHDQLISLHIEPNGIKGRW